MIKTEQNNADDIVLESNDNFETYYTNKKQIIDSTINSLIKNL